jgi:Sporulation protein YtfJ (Spore_YtfJ)
MEAQEILDQARKSIGAKSVYAEPVVQNGTTVIPAASVSGGGGAGSGDGPQGKGGGGGFGMKSRPTGAWVIDDGVVRWQPAVDVNRVILGGQIVALAAIFAARAIFGPRRSTRRRPSLPSMPSLPRLRRRRRSLPSVSLAVPHIAALRR